MSRWRSGARRVYEPITRRLDAVLWRLDVLERHRAADEERQEASRRQLEQALIAVRDELRTGHDVARAEVDAALADLRARLETLERRIAASHDSQIEGTTYLGRVIAEAPRRARDPGTGD